jgi:excinuclease ABC subunit C
MTFDHSDFLKTLPSKPGVYQMIDSTKKIIYVGKAKNLKRRVSSYFQKQADHPKTQVMINKIADINIIITSSENEALILEQNLIKELRPRYNILLRDDKSYPYIVLTEDSKFSRLYSYRGARRKDSRYFGPFTSTLAVKDSVQFLQKTFQIRNCTDSFFANRSRPCLQHEIKRCAAPCVGYISQEAYQAQVNKARLFLQGKNQSLLHTLATEMDRAATNLDFELAAQLRDQLSKLRQVQERQHVHGKEGEYDVLAIITQDEKIIISVLSVRGGKVNGNQNYFPRVPKGSSENETIAAFISQYYLNSNIVPQNILVNILPEDADWLSSVLSEQAQHKIHIMQPQRGDKMQWLNMATRNAQHTLNTALQQENIQQTRLFTLQQQLQLTSPIERIECFDISHHQGTATVASCVVYAREGFARNDYRCFNIKDVTAGDDYAALRQAMERRYKRILIEQLTLPSIVIIDGGRGQLQQAIDIFSELQIENVTLLSISKGPGRKAEYDQLWRVIDGKPQELMLEGTARLLIQQIRDEAHRFAITGHKKQKLKRQRESILESVAGVGDKRQRDLLKWFGGVQALENASVAEIAKVAGISQIIAQRIYDTLHS